MKKYGFYERTEYSQKQANVIYVNAKKGNLKISKELMSDIYFYADKEFSISSTLLGRAYTFEGYVKMILECIFKNNIEEAQKIINKFEGVLTMII